MQYVLVISSIIVIANIVNSKTIVDITANSFDIHDTNASTNDTKNHPSSRSSASVRNDSSVRNAAVAANTTSTTLGQAQFDATNSANSVELCVLVKFHLQYDLTIIIDDTPMTVRYSVTDKDVPIHERSCYELNQSITMSSENNAMSSITFRFEVDASGKMYTMSQIEIAINYTKGFTFSSAGRTKKFFYRLQSAYKIPVGLSSNCINQTLKFRNMNNYRLKINVAVSALQFEAFRRDSSADFNPSINCGFNETLNADRIVWVTHVCIGFWLVALLGLCWIQCTCKCIITKSTHRNRNQNLAQSIS